MTLATYDWRNYSPQTFGFASGTFVRPVGHFPCFDVSDVEVDLHYTDGDDNLQVVDLVQGTDYTVARASDGSFSITMASGTDNLANWGVGASVEVSLEGLVWNTAANFLGTKYSPSLMIEEWRRVFAAVSVAHWHANFTPTGEVDVPGGVLGFSRSGDVLRLQLAHNTLVVQLEGLTAGILKNNAFGLEEVRAKFAERSIPLDRLEQEVATAAATAAALALKADNSTVGSIQADILEQNAANTQRHNELQADIDEVKAGGLDDGSVTTPKLADNAVTADKMALDVKPPNLGREGEDFILRKQRADGTSYYALATTADAYGILNSGGGQDDNSTLHGGRLRSGTVPESALDSATRTKLNTDNSGSGVTGDVFSGTITAGNISGIAIGYNNSDTGSSGSSIIGTTTVDRFVIDGTYYTLERFIFWSDINEIYFGIHPDDEAELGADFQNSHTLIISRDGNILNFPLADFSIYMEGDAYESWASPTLSGDDLAKAQAIFVDGEVINVRLVKDLSIAEALAEKVDIASTIEEYASDETIFVGNVISATSSTNSYGYGNHDYHESVNLGSANIPSFLLYGKSYSVEVIVVREINDALQTASGALYFGIHPDDEAELGDTDFWQDKKLVISRGSDSITLDRIWNDESYTLAERWAADMLPDGGDPEHDPYIISDIGDTPIRNWTPALNALARTIMASGETFNLRLVQDKFIFKDGFCNSAVAPIASVGKLGDRLAWNKNFYIKGVDAWYQISTGREVLETWTELDTLTVPLTLIDRWQAVRLVAGTNLRDYNNLMFSFSGETANDGRTDVVIPTLDLHGFNSGATPYNLGGVYRQNDPGDRYPFGFAVQIYTNNNVIFIRDRSAHSGATNEDEAFHLLNAVGIRGSKLTLS